MPFKKFSFKVAKKTTNKFYQGELTMIMFLMIVTGIAFKLEKVGPTFSSFNPCSSLASVGTDDMTQIACLNIALNNKPPPLPLLYYFT